MNKPSTETEETSKDKALKQPEKPLTREQRRYKERIETEAMSVLNSLRDKFFDALMASDNPEGDELKEARKTMSAKWRLYCNKKRFTKAAYAEFDLYANDLLKKFEAEKNED